MANDLNRVTLIGRLVRDPGMKYTKSGTAVTNFSLANGRSYTVNGEKKEETSYFNCIAWAKLAEITNEYFRKGKQVAIEGRIQQQSWEDNEGKKRSKVEIVVENFQFLSPKDKTNTTLSSSEVGLNTVSPDEQTEIPNVNPFSDDDIPF